MAYDIELNYYERLEYRKSPFSSYIKNELEAKYSFWPWSLALHLAVL